MKAKYSAILYAILAAACYGISAPASKLLLQAIPPVMMAALLYLGAGLGMCIVNLTRGGNAKEAKITKKEFPFVMGMVVLDIAAPVLLMLGLSSTTSASASLLNNFEIVTTASIALLFFKEAIDKRMWIAIILMTIASMILTVEDFNIISVSPGSVLVLLACICWGIENNCTRMLSLKDPIQIVIVKGFGSGIGSLIIAIAISELSFNPVWILFALSLGFVAYGLSIYFYIHAQRQLGAARTSTYYAFAPFMGVGLSLMVFGQQFKVSFWIALVVMVAGAYYATTENHSHQHTHEVIEHEHRHNHSEQHHDHIHDKPIDAEHSHTHSHLPTPHVHKHTPDLHHMHRH